MLHIELLKSPGCAACTRAEQKVRRMLDWVRDTLPEAQIEEIDLTEHPKVAAKYGLLGGPAVSINGELVFRGVPKEERFKQRVMEIARMLKRRKGDTP